MWTDSRFTEEMLEARHGGDVATPDALQAGTVSPSESTTNIMKQQLGPSMVRLPLQVKPGSTCVARTPSTQRTRGSEERCVGPASRSSMGAGSREADTPPPKELRPWATVRVGGLADKGTQCHSDEGPTGDDILEGPPESTPAEARGCGAERDRQGHSTHHGPHHFICASHAHS